MACLECNDNGEHIIAFYEKTTLVFLKIAAEIAEVKKNE